MEEKTEEIIDILELPNNYEIDIKKTRTIFGDDKLSHTSLIKIRKNSFNKAPINDEPNFMYNLLQNLKNICDKVYNNDLSTLPK